jgi:hypothetical protein
LHKFYEKREHSAKIAAARGRTARLPGHHLCVLLPGVRGENAGQERRSAVAGRRQEVLEYREKTGKFPLWTNSMFGGMPAYLVGTDYPNSWSTKLGPGVRQSFP